MVRWLKSTQCLAGLVAAIMLGKRKVIPWRLWCRTTLCSRSPGLRCSGWVGLPLTAGPHWRQTATAFALVNTQIAGAAGALAWMAVEWQRHRKPSVLGIISGAVAGMVAITPSCGFVSPMGALAIGILAGIACFFASTSLKRKLKLR